MKYGMRILALAAVLAALAGCGNTEASVAEASAAEFGELVSAPEEQAEVTAAATAPTEPEAAYAEAAELPELTYCAVRSVVYGAYMDGVGYDPNSSGCFWRAISYLVGQTAEQDGAVTLTEAELAPYVAALFGGFEAQYPSVGEENPYAEEVYADGQTEYQIARWDLSDMTMTASEPEDQGDGTYLCRVEACRDGAQPSSYTVTLTDYAGTDRDGMGFSHSIAGLEKN